MHTECFNIFQLHKKRKNLKWKTRKRKSLRKKIHCVVGLWSTFYSVCVYERFA